MAVDVVDGGGFGERQVGEDGEAMVLRPGVGGEQDGGGAVGEGRGVACGHGAFGSAVNGLEAGELVGGGVGAQVLVAGEAEIGRDEIVEESSVKGGGHLAV